MEAAITSLSPRRLLEEMFQQMVIRKNAELIPHYYHPDFVLDTNGQQQGYEEFAAGHRSVYATDIAYSVRYDDATWVESSDRVAVRMWIWTERPGEARVEFEIVLIASLLDGKIHRLWELTWPDWSAEKAFEKY